MPDIPTNGTRRRIVRLLWVIVVLIVFGIGFGPVYVAAKNAEADLRIQCQIAENQTQQLSGIKLALEGEALIAQDLGLPVAQEIQVYLDNFDIPGVPPECVEL